MAFEFPVFEQRGRCTEVDPELFFPEYGATTKEAKQVCKDCPIQGPCLIWAVVNREQWGVWGGSTPLERRKIQLGYPVNLFGVVVEVGPGESQNDRWRAAGRRRHELFDLGYTVHEVADSERVSVSAIIAWQERHRKGRRVIGGIGIPAASYPPPAGKALADPQLA